MKLTLKLIAKLDKVPKEAKCAGKLDCVCNQCGKKTFHYLFELNTRSFVKCICGEVWEVEIISANA
jgi:hypothetical protein